MTELILKSGKTTTHIPIEAIVQVAGVRNYSLFWLRDGRRIMSAYTLKVYEDLLPPYFLRVHKAYLVNGHCIVSRAGRHELLLIDGSRVPVARRKADDFRQRYANLKTSGSVRNRKSSQ
jgi:two-component system, LytTR family, response regulator